MPWLQAYTCCSPFLDVCSPIYDKAHSLLSLKSAMATQFPSQLSQFTYLHAVLGSLILLSISCPPTIWMCFTNPEVPETPQSSSQNSTNAWSSFLLPCYWHLLQHHESNGEQGSMCLPTCGPAQTQGCTRKNYYHINFFLLGVSFLISHQKKQHQQFLNVRGNMEPKVVTIPRFIKIPWGALHCQWALYPHWWY